MRLVALRFCLRFSAGGRDSGHQRRGRTFFGAKAARGAPGPRPRKASCLGYYVHACGAFKATRSSELAEGNRSGSSALMETDQSLRD